jgi:hypothetical protein
MVVKYQPSKIKTGFTDYKNSDLSAFASAIISALTGNANFPLTQSMLEGLSISLASFKTAMNNAQSRDKTLIGIRDTARTELTLQLISVASSVTFEAQENRDKLLSSNFVLYKSRNTPATPLGLITRFKILDAAPTGLTLVCKGLRGVKSYTHQITPDPLTPDSVWTGLTGSSRERTYYDLPSGKKFWCRIIATGTKGQASYSDTLCRITQ